MTFPFRIARRSTLKGWLLLGLLGAALGQGCSSSSNPKPSAGSGAAPGGAGKGSDSMVVQPPGTSGMAGESPYDPLCGIVDAKTCVPDDTDAVCKDKVVSSNGGKSAGSSAGRGSSGTSATQGGTSSGASGGASSGVPSGEAGVPQGGAPGTSGEGPAGGGGAPAGQGGESPIPGGQSGQGGAGAGGEAGVPGLGAAAGKQGVAGRAPGVGGGGGQPVVTMRQAQSCQVAENSAHKGQPLAQCLPAGEGTDGSACFSGSDCAPGFACVGSGPGLCRAYCCGDKSQCQDQAGTHCTVERQVSEKAGTVGLNVPVCMPAVKCSLAEPFPCAGAPNCSCPDGSACGVVTDDGTTSCVPVSEFAPDGKGREGDACPCAHGYVCSATGECLKLCELTMPEECDSNRCQSSVRLPDGWGTCIGASLKDAGAP